MAIGRLNRIFLVVLGTMTLIATLFCIAPWMLTRNEYPSNIEAFQPTVFPYKATVPFFYSVNGELKYSDHIDVAARTLMRGEIENFLVSPDNLKIAVVADGRLVIVHADGATQQVAQVDSIYRDVKPIGTSFFRDEDFQWSMDSSELYIIKDRYYVSKGSQLFSDNGELWRYELKNGAMQLVLKPFHAFNYFFGEKTGIYFSEPNSSGNLQLRFFDGKSVSDVGVADGINRIPSDEIPLPVSGPAFCSFPAFDERRVLESKGVRMDESTGTLEDLMIAEKQYLQLSQGIGFKGPYFCADINKSVFLPGDRYLLFNFFCGNYKGPLLIDTSSARYSTLPKETRAYVPLNTETYPNYVISSSGIDAISKLPSN